MPSARSRRRAASARSPPTPNCSRSAGRRRGCASLEFVAAEALADHVELVEARIREGDAAAFGTVPDRDLEPQQVAELALERRDVGRAALMVDRRRPLAARLAGAGELLGLAHRQAAADDLLGEGLGIACRDERPGMTHRQLAG